jgi:gluconate kinase
MALWWITGQSGAGKSTLAAGLSKTGQSVLQFDADALFLGHNPYDVHEGGLPPPPQEDTERLRELRAVWKAFGATFKDYFAGKNPTIEEWAPVYRIVAEELKKRPKNVTVVVAFSIYPMLCRDYIRTLLPEVKFIVLNDKQGLCSKRKFAQVKKAIDESGKSVAEFLKPFDAEKDIDSFEKLQALMDSRSRGLDDGDEAKQEFQIDLDESRTAVKVLEMAKAIIEKN